MHTYIHACIHTYKKKYTYIHTYVYIHTCIYIYIYMYIHTYIYIYLCANWKEDGGWKWKQVV